ncbi:MAG: methyltransferase domain-containing protein [Acidimicrobiales bacterium]|nr:methyltransferase domain-containing protein [Acidimicrobiales bacterium]
MTLTADEVRAIRAGQDDDIERLRREMAGSLARLAPRSVLSVGEGCDRRATFVGGCLATGALPGSTELVVPFDLEAAAESFHHAGPPSIGPCRLAPLLGDVLAPPLRAGSFDLVVASLMIDDVDDPPAAVVSMAALTRPGGTLLVSGHGIDVVPEWRGVHGILGAFHDHQVHPHQAGRWVVDAGATVTGRRVWDHTWLVEAVAPSA